MLFVGLMARSLPHSSPNMPRLATTSWSSLFVLLCAVAGILALGSGCDLSDDDDARTVTVSGRVLNAATQTPLPDVVVTIQFLTETEERETSAVTDSTGQFSTEIELRSPTDVTFTASRGGVDAEVTERISPELGEVEGIDLELALEEDESEPGQPTNITLSDQSTDVIRVQESGGPEVARLTFQVVDSTGTPIDVDQAVDVDFRFGQQPGDATLTPESETTDGEGTATVNVASGTTAGIVQVVAETEKADGTAIRSKPVRVTVHGGLPNKCHFTVAPAQSNFPGLVTIGLENTITTIVGDKFGNPVVPGTSVSFSTNAGIIGGSTQTDDAGQGSVTLTSAEPLPADGVGTVRAETVGSDDFNTIVDPDNCPDPAETGNENLIVDTVPVVFSGRPELTVRPDSAAIDQTYELRVRDIENGNPLAPGTTISVEAEGSQVQATGNTDVTLDDTTIRDDNGDDRFGAEDVVTGEGITDFTFRIAEDPDPENPDPPSIESVTISIGGPNGELEIVLTPSGRGSSSAQTRTQGAALHHEADAVTVRAPKTQRF